MNEYASSADNISDSDLLNKCEQQLKELGEDMGISESGKSTMGEIRLAEKRKEREDDFITVNRRSKHFVRSDSLEIREITHRESDEVTDISNNEVCITSLENLPKPIAMAKLLRSENIKNILKVKYKGYNKVLILCQRKEDARKLLNCEKLKDMGLRCQLTQDMSVSYAVVKGIDLELSEEELMSIFNSNVEILSVKRLKRLNIEGKWVDCESVRICFKSQRLPEYIYAYDCRFAVEAYVFPVTQCSGCWQFGHIVKYCPSKTILCPKCGGKHENCETKDFKCLNCKGNHFVLDKTCPAFVKEKTIRKIMSEEQITYRRALQRYLEKKEKNRTEIPHGETVSYMTNSVEFSGKETYSAVLKKTRHQEPIQIQEEIQESDESTPDKVTRFRRKTTKKTKRINQRRSELPTEQLVEVMDEEKHASQKEEDKTTKKEKQHKLHFEWKKMWLKLKSVCMSERNFEEKLLQMLKIIGEEIKFFLVNILFGEDVAGFLNYLNNG
ncbi:uncharacterized protein LOC111355417 [Spodoptera litura]|uniref:Uncharacterized protein LOC111355417 n=1 Tax=Spodoptera litura TaxID=69820 RepID=A0A9J7ITC0_SPOLT|nr:uncharacterized protein LOC111355417 [Spodoptera litura]